jgi:glycine/D-amino acid oxidase-like deaminating enzyme
MRCLIVGQGIAGAVLAWTLQRRGVVVHVADADFPHRSSSIAAGIINPVTGKRYVKTWRYDDFFPVAKSVYQTMEAQWGVPIWHDQTILRLL